MILNKLITSQCLDSKVNAMLGTEYLIMSCYQYKMMSTYMNLLQTSGLNRHFFDVMHHKYVILLTDGKKNFF